MRTLILLLVSVTSWGAGFTVVRSGNWSSTNPATSPWCTTAGACTALVGSGPGGVPGNGDTITKGNTYTLTVDTAAANANSKGVAYITRTNAGSGYTGQCGVSFSGGGSPTRSAAAVCEFWLGHPVLIQVTDPGEGYSSAPTVTFTGATGSGATGTANMVDLVYIGTSPATDGTDAIVISGNTGGSLTIAPGAGLVLRGPVQMASGGGTADAVVMQAGSAWVWDTSQAADNQHYVYYPVISSVSRGFRVNGTAEAPCLITSTPGGGNGAFLNKKFSSGTDANALPLTLSYAHVSRLGTTTVPAFRVNNQSWSITNSALYASGKLYLSGGVTPTYNYNFHRHGLAAALDFFAGASAGNFLGNVFDANGVAPVSNASSVSFVNQNVSGNYLDLGTVSTSGSPVWTGFTNNLLARGLYTAGGNGIFAQGDVADNYMWRANGGNPWHWTFPGYRASSGTGGIFDVFGVASTDTGDAYGITTAPSVDTTYVLRNNIILPQPKGDGAYYTSGILASAVIARLHQFWDIQQNASWGGGWSGSGGLIVIESLGQDNGGTANVVVSMKNNIQYRPDTSLAASLILDTHPSPGSTTQVATSSVANTVNNVCFHCEQSKPANMWLTNQGNAYIAKMPAVAGASDWRTLDPRLGDVLHRNLVLFDQGYLGVPLSSVTWDAGATYTYGQVVSHLVSYLAGGRSVNYRCKLEAGCSGATANSEPGVGSAWDSTWEINAAYLARVAIGVQATWTDGAIGCVGCTYTQALMSWIRQAWDSQEPIFWCGGSGGVTVGHRDVCAARKALLAAIQ